MRVALDSVPRSAGPAVAGRDAEQQQAETIAAIRAAADVLAPLAARCGGDLDRFLDELALGAEVDTWDPRADRISLLTLHAAKGLEFPVVFIAGCDDGLLPLRPWSGAEVDYAEERRLLFVGMTRATTRLYLSYAAQRARRGAIAGGGGLPPLLAASARTSCAARRPRGPGALTHSNCGCSSPRASPAGGRGTPDMRIGRRAAVLPKCTPPQRSVTN